MSGAASGAASDRREPRAVGERALIACAVAGPAAWFVLLCVAWAVAPPAHETGRRGLLLGLHAIALALSIAPGAVALRELRRQRRAAAAPHGAPGLDPAAPDPERARFLAGSAAALSATAALLVLASALALLFLAPGAEP